MGGKRFWWSAAAVAAALCAWAGAAFAGPPPLTLADFENPDDARVQWSCRSAVIVQSGSHASHGNFGAKVVFKDDVSPKISMAGYLRFDGERSNWSRFLALAIDFYNPSPAQERLGIQLKDAKGKVYKEEIILQSGV